MTSTAAIPTVLLSDDNAIPVLGISVGELPPDRAGDAVSAALAAGIRLIDASPIDGNEEAVGRAIATSGVPREELFVTTKLATADQGFQASQDACKASLARLGLDYVDLYLIHWPAEQNGRYVDAWGGLMKVREIGETRSIGVSNFTPDNLTDVIDLSFVTPVINQVELHPRLIQSELRAFHAQHGIVTQAYCPLAGGALLDNATVVEVAAARQDPRPGAHPVEHPVGQCGSPAGVGSGAHRREPRRVRLRTQRRGGDGPRRPPRRHPVTAEPGHRRRGVIRRRSSYRHGFFPIPRDVTRVTPSV